MTDVSQPTHAGRWGQAVTVRQEPGEAPCHLPPSTASLNAGKGMLCWLSSGVVFCACLGARSFSVEGGGPYTAFMTFLWQGLPGQANLLSSLPCLRKTKTGRCVRIEAGFGDEECGEGSREQ